MQKDYFILDIKGGQHNIHDMWVDFDHYENTGTPDVFDEANLDEYIDNPNDWD